MAGLPATGQTGTTTPLPPIGSGNTLNGLTQYQPQSRAEATAGLDYAFQGGHIDDAQRQQMLGQFDTMQWQQPALPAFGGQDFAKNIMGQFSGGDTPWATDSAQFLAADVNKDGKLDISDSISHLRYAAGLEDPSQTYNYNQLATAIKPKSAGRGETAEEYAAREDVKLYNQRINAAPAQTGEQVYNEWLKNNPQPIQQPIDTSQNISLDDFLNGTQNLVGGSTAEATKAQAGYGSIPEGVLGVADASTNPEVKKDFKGFGNDVRKLPVIVPTQPKPDSLTPPKQPVIAEGHPFAKTAGDNTTPDWISRNPHDVNMQLRESKTFTNPDTGETFSGDPARFSLKGEESWLPLENWQKTVEPFYSIPPKKEAPKYSDTVPDWMTKIEQPPNQLRTMDVRFDTFTNPETGETFVGDMRDYESKFGAPDAKTGGTPAPEPTAEQKRQQIEAFQKQLGIDPANMTQEEIGRMQQLQLQQQPNEEANRKKEIESLLAQTGYDSIAELHEAERQVNQRINAAPANGYTEPRIYDPTQTQTQSVMPPVGQPNINTLAAQGITAAGAAAAQGLDFTPSDVSADNIYSSTVNPNAVYAGMVNPGTVASGAYTPGTVTASTVNPNNINASAVAAERVNPNNINASSVAAERVNPNNINASAVTASTVNPNNINASTVNPNTIANLGLSDRVTANQLANTSLDPYMNPYTQAVIQANETDILRGADVRSDALAAQAQAAGAFGGSRHGIAMGEMDRNTLDQLARSSAGLRQANYGQAQQAALSDIGTNLQGQFANQAASQYDIGKNLEASLANQATGLQGQLANQSNLYNTQLANQQAGLQGQLANQRTGLEAGLANQANLYNTQLANQQAGLQGQLANQRTGLEAGLANQSNLYNTQLANQQAGLQGQLANQQTGLEAGLANQRTGLTAGLANVATDLQANLANQATGLQGQLANQATDLQAGMSNQQAGLQGQLANQNNLYNTQLANQSANLQAALANQGAGMQGQNMRLDAANQLANISNLGFGMGQTVNNNMMQQGMMQQALQQALFDAAQQNYGEFTGHPAEGLQYLNNALGITPYGQTTTTTGQPGLFDYLTLATQWPQ